MEHIKKGISESWVTIIIASISLLGGILINSVTNAVSLTDKVATKNYVDEKMSASKMYVDDKMTDVKRYIDSGLLESRQYSELKVKSMEIQLQSAVSDVKADVKSMIVKQDLMFEMMKANKERK